MRTIDRWAAGAAFAALLALGGCGASGSADGPALVFSGPPALSAASATGALTVDFRFSPGAPVVGLDAAQLTIVDSAGTPAVGLTVSLVPWMPAHGHGTSTMPDVWETGPGVYVATPVNFFMPGEWELRTTLSGPVDDTVAPSLVVE